jgi:hypothetical protein
MENVECAPENHALVARFHFFLPTALNLAAAKRSIDKPAKMPCPVFPSRTNTSVCLRAFALYPARPVLFVRLFLECQEKENLAFRMDWNISPALLETLDSFEKSANQRGHLVLSLFQMMSDFG